MNSIRFQEQSCPLCLSASYESPYDLSSDYLYGKLGWFPIVCCINCEIVYTKIIPDIESINYYYPDSYNHYIVNHLPSKINKNSWFSGLLNSRKLPTAPPATVFEIGASNGAFLGNLIELGYDAYGIEPSANKINYSDKLKSRIINKSFDSNYIFANKYDLIVAWMVLEHLYNPLDCCKLIKSGLNANGFFVGSVPSLQCFGRIFFRKAWYGYQVPTHFTHFDVKSLKKLLLLAGFNEVNITYQANCMNFLRSMQIFFRLRKMKNLEKITFILITSKKLGKFRALFSLLLKLFKMSGRLEFTAKA